MDSIKEKVVTWVIYAIFGLLSLVVMFSYTSYYDVKDNIYSFQIELSEFNKTIIYDAAFAKDAISIIEHNRERLSHLENGDYKNEGSVKCEQIFCNKKISDFDVLRYTNELNKDYGLLGKYNTEDLDTSLPIYRQIKKLLDEESEIWDKTISLTESNQSCNGDDYVRMQNKMWKPMYLILGAMENRKMKFEEKQMLFSSQTGHRLQKIKDDIFTLSLAIFFTMLLLIVVGVMFWWLFDKKHAKKE